MSTYYNWKVTTMSERRAWWTDDLIGSVIGEIGAVRPSTQSIRDVAYAVIAAVEDHLKPYWQGQSNA